MQHLPRRRLQSPFTRSGSASSSHHPNRDWVILLGVQDPEHYHAIANHLVENLVWEAPQYNATKVQVVEAFPLGILLQPSYGDCDRVEEVVSQRSSFASIPVAGIGEIALRFWPDKHDPTHESSRSRASTSRQGEPADGSASYASLRFV
jgi:hypothetical protein